MRTPTPPINYVLPNVTTVPMGGTQGYMWYREVLGSVSKCNGGSISTSTYISNDSSKTHEKDIRGHIMSLNISGMISKDYDKRAELLDLAKEKNIFIICLQETHNRGREANETHLEGFREFGKNHTRRQCGGVATYVADKFTVSHVRGFSHDYCESSVEAHQESG